MVSASTIEDSLRLLSECFSHFKNTSTVGDVLYDELSAISDEALISAVRYLIANETYTPKVADIVGHAKRIASSGANRAVIREEYVDYSDRSPAERAAIDEASSKCLRVMAGLANGVPVEDLFPPDSEPVRLGREMAERRERWGQREETGKAKAVSVYDVARGLLEIDCKAKASGEREEPEFGLDW